jgi:hypothetical protein
VWPFRRRPVSTPSLPSLNSLLSEADDLLGPSDQPDLNSLLSEADDLLADPILPPMPPVASHLPPAPPMAVSHAPTPPPVSPGATIDPTTVPQTPIGPPPVQPSWLDRTRDAGITALQGAISVPEAAVGVLDVVTTPMRTGLEAITGQDLATPGEALERFGFRPADAKQILDTYYSTAQQRAFSNVDEAEGWVATASALLENPSVIFHAALESAPSMVAGGAAGRAVTAAAPRLASAAGAIGEGLVGAGSAAENIRQETGDLSAGQAAIAAGSGAVTSAIGRFGAKLADRLGIVDVDTLLAGAAANPTSAAGLVKALVLGAVHEGFVEELPQSAQEQIAQNMATNRPWDEHVDQAAVLGAFTGAVMGAGGQAYSAVTGAQAPVEEQGQGAGGLDVRIPPSPAPEVLPVVSPDVLVSPVVSEPIAPPPLPDLIAEADAVLSEQPVVEGVPHEQEGLRHEQEERPQEVDPLETDQDRSHREWRENAGRVAGDPQNASEKDLRRAIGYLSAKRASLIRNAQKEGREISPDTLRGIDAEMEWYTRLAAEKAGWVEPPSLVLPETPVLPAAGNTPVPDNAVDPATMSSAQIADEYVRRNPTEGSFDAHAVSAHGKRLGRLADRVRKIPWRQGTAYSETVNGVKTSRIDRLKDLVNLGVLKMAWDKQGEVYYGPANQPVKKGLTDNPTDEWFRTPDTTKRREIIAKAPLAPAFTELPAKARRWLLWHVADQEQGGEFVPKGFGEHQIGRGGDRVLTAGAGGAESIYNFVAGSPETGLVGEESRAEVLRKLRAYIYEGKRSTTADRAVQAALEDLSGDPMGRRRFNPRIPLEAGNEPGQIYVDPDPTLTEDAAVAQAQAIDALERDAQGYVTRYTQAHPDGIVSAERAKALFSVQHPEGTRTAADALAQAVYRQALAQPTSDDQFDMVLLASGPNDQVVQAPDAGGYKARYDDAIRDVDTGRALIRDALNSGHAVTVAHTRSGQDESAIKALVAEFSGDENVTFEIYEQQPDGVFALVDTAALETEYNRADGQAGPGQTRPEAEEAPPAGVARRSAAADARSAEQETEVDILDTGETQPRLPGAESVRETEVGTPTFDAPFSLSAEVGKTSARSSALAFDEDIDEREVPGDVGMASRYIASFPMATTLPSTPGRAVSAPAAIDALGDVTEAAGKRIVMRIGRVGGQRLGVWKTRAQVIRTRTANDIPTAAHEVAHALQRLLLGADGGGPWKKPRASVPMQRELVALGHALYGSRKPNGGYKSEGWAEFIRTWVTESDLQGHPANVRSVAPETHAWFDGPFKKDYPEVYTALERARDLTRRWREQGSKTRAEASVVDPGTPRERLREAGRQVRRFVSMEKLVEMAQPLFEMAREAEDALGRPLAPSEDPFFTLSALRTTHDARTRYMVEESMIDLAGNPVGPPLADMRPLVEGKREAFTIYLWARRALALWTDPHGPRNPGLTLEDAQQIIQELETPGFQLAASKVYAWNESVLDYAAQSSPTFADIVQRVRKRDPGNYVPLQREFEELDARWSKVRRAGVKGTPVQRLAGSGRRIKDIFPVLIAQAAHVVRQAHMRLVVDQMIRLSGVEGLGHLIEELPPDKFPAATRSLQNLIEQVEREIRKQDPDAEVNVEGDDLDLTTAVTFFAPVFQPSGKDPIIPVMDQGRLRWFELDGALFDALNSLDVYRLPDVAGLPIAEWLLGKPAAAFRAGTTGLRASFGLVWNPLKDVQTMAVNTQSTKNAGTLFAHWLKAWGAMALSRTGIHASPWVDAWIRLGGEMAQPLGQDIPHTRRAARRLFAGRTVRTLDPRNWFDFYRDLVQFPEGAPRVAELELLAKEIGWKPGQPMTIDQSLQLLLASKQITTDFTAAGEVARVVNRMVPFHNAAIQGPRANLRALKRHPIQFAWRGLMLSALTLALWAQYKDEEWYKTMPYRDRFLHWFFPVSINGRDELIRIPRAFEIGMIFAALPEMLMDAWYRQEPEAATEWLQTLQDVTTPDVTPVLLRVAKEQWQNRQWPDRPIVSLSQIRKPADEQFDEYTSRAAITLGRIFNQSPKRIDHVIRGTAGPVAGDLLTVLGHGPKATNRELEPSDALLIGRLFQRGGTQGVEPQPIRDLFDAVEEAQLRQHSDRVKETTPQREHRLQLENAADAVAALLVARRYAAPLDERRALTADALAIAEEVLSTTGLRRSRFLFLRQRAEKRRDRLQPKPQ